MSIAEGDWTVSAEWYVARLDEMMQLLAGKDALTKTEAKVAHDMLEVIKQRFDDERRSIVARRSAGALSEIEESYLRTLRDAQGQVAAARTDTHPLRGRWASQLYACKVEFTQFLHRAQRPRRPRSAEPVAAAEANGESA